MELTFPSWGWAHSRQSCWWTRDSTWVIVQNSWGRKIVGSNVKMCDSCRRDYAGTNLTWQGYSFSRQSWWTGHQEAWVEVLLRIQIKLWVGTCLNVPMIASFRETRSSWYWQQCHYLGEWKAHFLPRLASCCRLVVRLQVVLQSILLGSSGQYLLALVGDGQC